MQELVSLLLWKCNDSIRWYARLLITVVHVMCCTICPNFRYDTVLEFITSFWIIFVYLICVAVYCAGLFSPHSAKTTSSTLRRASDPTFYPSWEVMLSSPAPTLSVISYFHFLNLFFNFPDKKSIRLRQPLLRLPSHRHGSGRSFHPSRSFQCGGLRSHRQSTPQSHRESYS